MCVLPNVWPHFPQNVKFYKRARGCATLPPNLFLESARELFLMFCLASVLARFLIVFFVLMCLGGGPKGGHV